MSYFQAIKLDHRNIFSQIWNAFYTKIEILSLIFLPQNFCFLPVQLSAFLFGLILSITINVFLLSEDSISKSFTSIKGGVSFGFAFLISLISNIIAGGITAAVTGLTDYVDLLLVIMVESQYSDYAKKLLRKYVRSTIRNLRKFFIIELIVMIPCIYYMLVYCSVYTNTQKTLFYSYFIGILTRSVYTLATVIVLGILRFASLKLKVIRCL